MTGPARVGGLARVAGRGFLITLVFTVSVQALSFVQGLLVPRLLGPQAIGVYALAIAVVAFGTNLREFGLHDKVIQEREVDLPRAYSVAFTLEMALATVMFVLVAVAAPIVAALYDRPSLVPLILALGVTVYTSAFLKLPGAVHLRKFHYGRQNLIQSLRPIVSFSVTVPLAFLGAGVWALAGGAIATTVVAALVVTWGMSLRPRLRFERPVAKRFLRFGWPIWVTNIISLSTTWAGTFVISAVAGIAVLGYFTVARQIVSRAFLIENVIARTIFPVLARAQDDQEGQRRAFTAANRITVLWAGPLGFGLFVFAPDVVNLILGPEWEPATFLLQMQGLGLAIGSIGYSWHVFFHARGETRPTLVFGIVSEAWVFVVLLPAVAIWGVTGAAWAVGSLGVIAVLVRQIMISRLFPGINLFINARWELGATATAALLAGGFREVVGPPTGLAGLAVHGLVFLFLTAVVVVAVDHRFLRDMLRRVRRRPAAAPAHPGGVESSASAALDGDYHEASLEPSAGGASDLTAPLDPARRSAHRIGEEIEVPGSFPLYLTAAPNARLWVTLRDSSSVALLDVSTRRWRSWRFPAYPHVVGVDARGRAWMGLTIASAVAMVDPEQNRRLRVRLPRTREVLVAACEGETCLVVDSGKRVLWELDEQTRRSIALPDGMRRPDFVVVAPNGDRWITDTAQPSLGLLPGDGAPSRRVAMPAKTRVAVVAPDGQDLWVGHCDRPMVSRLSLAAPDDGVESFEVPGIPFGLAFDDRGRLMVALPGRDAVALLVPGGSVDLVELTEGSEPHSVAWLDGRFWVACSGTSRLVVLR